MARRRKGSAVQKAYSRGAAKKPLPQRHRIVAFAAVAAIRRKGSAVQKAYCRGTAKKPLPQRHRITAFAAVAARIRKGNAVQKAYCRGAAKRALPQRHQIAGNAAVVARRRKGNAAQKACRRGTAKRALPQRHQITAFAAVVVIRLCSSYRTWLRSLVSLLSTKYCLANRRAGKILDSNTLLFDRPSVRRFKWHTEEKIKSIYPCSQHVNKTIIYLPEKI